MGVEVGWYPMCGGYAAEVAALCDYRVKTDVRDARHLGRLLHLGEITAETVPSVEQEATRDPVRVREDSRENLMAARHRLSTRLLRQGIGYCEHHVHGLQLLNGHLANPPVDHRRHPRPHFWSGSPAQPQPLARSLRCRSTGAGLSDG